MNASPRIAAALLALFCCAASGPAAPEHCVLSVEENGGRVSIFDREGGRLASVPIGDRPHEVEVSADGRRAFVSQFGIADYDNRIGTPGGKVVEIDLTRGIAAGVFVMPAGRLAPHGVKLRPGRTSELFVNTEVGGDTMVVFDTRTRTVTRTFAIPAGTHNFIFARDGSVLFSFAGKAGVSKIDAVTGRVLATNGSPGSPVRGLELASSGDILAGAKGEVLVLDPRTLRIKRRMASAGKGQLLYLQQLAAGGVAAPSMDDNGIVLFSGGSAKLVPTGKTPIFTRQAPDGLIYVSNVMDSYVSVVDTSGTVLRRIDGLQGPNGLAFGRCPGS